MRIIGTFETNQDLGAVRVEDVFDTGVTDLWDACTAPERLARWIGVVSGDLRAGGRFAARFTSGWEGTGRVETCDPPRRLTVVTTDSETAVDTEIALTLTPTAPGAGTDRTVLVIEERGLPLDQLPAYGAGWQVHVEDLAAHLDGQGRCDVQARWRELYPHYQQVTIR